MVLVDGRKYGLLAAELLGVPSDADLADDIVLTTRLDGEPLLTASKEGYAQNGRVTVPLKVRTFKCSCPPDRLRESSKEQPQFLLIKLL